MANEDKKALMIRAPNDGDTGVNDDFGERLFTVDGTHKAHAMPAGWAGRWVELISSVNAWYAFSIRSGAEVDRAVAATDAGASAKVGRQLFAGVPRSERLPDKLSGDTLYFVREAASAGNVQIGLTDYGQP